jgi:citrate synthase
MYGLLLKLNTQAPGAWKDSWPMSNPAETGISQLYPDRILVRGYNLVALAHSHSFGDVVYLLLRGELPRAQEGRLIEEMLVLMAEHSINAPSVHVARAVASCGSPVQSAIAAGVNAIGDHHGGAGEACARLLQEALAGAPNADLDQAAQQVVQDYRRQGKRLPGFGHRFHNPDPRAAYLLQRASALGIAGRHVALAQALVQALQRASGTSLPLNIDGALAALLSDMGFDWRLGKGLFIIARTAGLVAHVHEEITTGKPLGAAPVTPVHYTGTEERAP